MANYKIAKTATFGIAVILMFTASCGTDNSSATKAQHPFDFTKVELRAPVSNGEKLIGLDAIFIEVLDGSEYTGVRYVFDLRANTLYREGYTDAMEAPGDNGLRGVKKIGLVADQTDSLRAVMSELTRAEDPKDACYYMNGRYVRVVHSDGSGTTYHANSCNAQFGEATAYLDLSQFKKIRDFANSL